MLNGLKCELKETKALLYKHKSDSKEKEKHLTDKKRDAGNVQRQLSSVEQNIRKIVSLTVRYCLRVESRHWFLKEHSSGIRDSDI